MSAEKTFGLGNRLGTKLGKTGKRKHGVFHINKNKPKRGEVQFGYLDGKKLTPKNAPSTVQEFYIYLHLVEM